MSDLNYAKGQDIRWMALFIIIKIEKILMFDVHLQLWALIRRYLYSILR